MRNALWPALALLLAVFALALSGGATSHNAAAGGTTLVVTSAADVAHGSCGATCTLRDALTAADATDTINFNIPGAGPHVIEIQGSELPAIISKNGLTINGYSQPGSHANTAETFQPGDANIQIVLDGHRLTSGNRWGLWLSSDNLTVQGISFVNFADYGIKVATFAASATIVGNYIGVYPDGHTAGPNGTGILLRSSKDGNSIGGGDPSKRNLISGNTGDGISITGSTPVAIAGNFIGTDVTGSQALPNGANGIDMAGGTDSTIGGQRDYGGNLISGNGLNGVSISTDAGSNMNVKGNYIGVAADGETPLPNGHDGVYISQNAENNTIGGDFVSAERNIIAYNPGAGVGLASSAGPDNYVDPNFLYSNGGLGVDIMDDGAILPNDYGDSSCNGGANPTHCPDADGGTDGVSAVAANRLMNFPVITNATYTGTTLYFEGTLDTFPGHYYNMFFFWNDACDPSGYGEGRYFLGSLGFNANGVDNTFDRTFNNVSLSGDVYLTMSASDPESSSEFSQCFVIHTGNATPAPTPTHSPTPSPSSPPTQTPPPTAPPTPKQGDMNCDDNVNTADVVQFFEFLATGKRGTAAAGCPGVGDGVGDHGANFMDADCSGDETAFDGLIILIHLANAPGLPLPSGCVEVGDRV